MLTFFSILSEIEGSVSQSNLNAMSNSDVEDPHAALKEKILSNYEKNPEDFKRIEGTNQVKYEPSGWGSTERALSWYGFRRGLNK